MFKTIIFKNITPLLTHLISCDQHGFVNARSTTTNQLVFQKYILDVFSSGYQIEVISTDFSKAFDKVDHTILISKLFSISIRDPFLSWFPSYISNRKIIIKYINFISILFNVSSGVPQCTHLVPIIFLIFINDLNVLNSRKLLFDDDMKLFSLIKKINDTSLLEDEK